MKRNTLSKPEVKAISYICDVYLKCISNEKFGLEKLTESYKIGNDWTTALSTKYIKSRGKKTMSWQWVAGGLSYDLIQEIIQYKYDRQSEYKSKYNEKVQLVKKPIVVEIDKKTIELDFDKREPVKKIGTIDEVSVDEFNMFKQLAKKLFGI
jgi:hypothetical protein